LCILIIFSFFLSNAFSQLTGDPHEDFLEGEYYVSQGMYVDALPYFLSVLKKDTSNSNINYRVGLCYMKQTDEVTKALPYLQKAVREVNMKYVDGKFKNTGAPPEVWILLGDAYFQKNKLDDASSAYIKYRDLIGNNDKEKSDVIKKRIDGVDVSKELQRTSQNLQFLDLGSKINTKNSESNPVLSGDQNTIIYTQIRDGFEKILVSHRANEEWSTPLDITRQIGSEGDCYSTGISFDGTELYVIKHDDVNSDIYVAKLVKGKWQKLLPISGKINTKYHESSACVSSDGKYLYFSSDRPKGIGGFDIYVAEKTGDTWGNVKNLGNVINTVKDEADPYISADGKVLYFSSNGHKTVGNMDILYSEKDAGGNWQTPVNPGGPINTTSDEMSYIYFNDTKTGYLSRSLPQGIGKNDIYATVPAKEEAAIPEVLTASTEISASSGTAKIDTIVNIPVIENTEKRKDTVVAMAQYKAPIEPVVISPVQNEKVEARVIPEKKTIVPPIKKSSIHPENKSAFLPDINSVYTIQIVALLHPDNAQKIKLSPLVISLGDDGYYRYTHGEFKDIIKAQSSLKSLEKKGFHDAFIRKINTISNYSKSK
jgi:tetratricopeptide (TPR) repeat protein